MTSLATAFEPIRRPRPRAPTRRAAPGRLARERPRNGAQQRREFRNAVVAGLSAPLCSLPSRYFYDPLGSELVRAIAESSDYYLARCESAIVGEHADEIAALVPSDAVLIEFGCGPILKTETLLDRLPDLRAYAPVDLSRRAVDATVRRLSACFPDLDIRPLLADFGEPLGLPTDLAGASRAVLFPGSTIGALRPAEACDLLAELRTTLNGGVLIVGVDLVKDVDVMIRAYDDPKGMMEALHLNLLERINRELDADFDIRCFRHEAVWNSAAERVEMRLVSLCNQRVEIDRREFRFFGGERIHVEDCYKYSLESFGTLAHAADLEIAAVWIDPAYLFSLHVLRAT